MGMATSPSAGVVRIILPATLRSKLNARNPGFAYGHFGIRKGRIRTTMLTSDVMGQPEKSTLNIMMGIGLAAAGCTGKVCIVLHPASQFTWLGMGVCYAIFAIGVVFASNEILKRKSKVPRYRAPVGEHERNSKSG